MSTLGLPTENPVHVIILWRLIVIVIDIIAQFLPFNYILYLFITKFIIYIYIKCMYIQIYKCRQITIQDHNSGISGENANEPSNSFKRFRKSKHSSEILPSKALLLWALHIYSTLIFSQHVIFLWSTHINSSGCYIVIDIIYQFLSNIDVTLMLSMSVFSKIL